LADDSPLEIGHSFVTSVVEMRLSFSPRIEVHFSRHQQNGAFGRIRCEEVGDAIADEANVDRMASWHALSTKPDGVPGS